MSQIQVIDITTLDLSLYAAIGFCAAGVCLLLSLAVGFFISLLKRA